MPATPPGDTDVCPNPILREPVEALSVLEDVMSGPSAAPTFGLVTEIVGQHLWPDQDPSHATFTRDDDRLVLAGGPGGRFDTDPYMKGQHAALVPTAEGVVVEELALHAAVYLRAGARLPLRNGDQLRVGQQLLRFHLLEGPTTESGPNRARPFWGRLAVMLDANREAAAYPLREHMAEIGRDRGDVQFPFDATVGDPHCWIELDPEDGPVLICDRGGPPVYVRIEHGEMVTYDSELLVGQTRLQLSRRDAVS